MNVLLAAVSFPSKMSGIQRYAFNLARCLLMHEEISGVHLVIAPWQQQMLQSVGLPTHDRLRIHVAQVKPGPVHRNLWYYTALPRLANELRPDVVHLSYPVPTRTSEFRCPVILALHDLYPYEVPSNFRFPHVLFNRLILQQSIRAADAIVCVSDATLASLAKHAPKSACDRAMRIYNCVDRSVESAPEALSPRVQGPPFLLCVAQHRRNKNICLLIRVFGSLLNRGCIHPSTHLVVVGIPGPETGRIRALASTLKIQEQVVFIDGLSDAALEWCYTHCEALVAPSLTEGFGLPVAEALLAGCKVICSDIPVLREIGGDHCSYFRLGIEEEKTLATALLSALRQPRQSPVLLPFLSAGVLSQKYVTLYRKVAEARYDRLVSERDGTVGNTSAFPEV